MWNLIILLAVFCCGYGIGKSQLNNSNTVVRINYLEDLIEQEYKNNYEIKQKLIESEQNVETWKRRYQSLIPIDKE